MDKHLGKDIENLVAREAFLKDNCDKVEEKGYMKPYTPEQLQQRKEELANASIEIAEIEQEAKKAAAHYKGKLKPLKSRPATADELQTTLFGVIRNQDATKTGTDN